MYIRQMRFILSILTACLSAGCASKAWTPRKISEGTVETLRDSTVDLRSYGGVCSGAFVRPGIIITASHCVQSGLNIEFSQYKDQNRFFEADVIYHDPKADVSILRSRVDVPSTYLEIDPDLAKLTADETVATMGHPMKLESFSDWFAPKRQMYRLSTGGIIAFSDNAIYADIKVAPGNSGGPLISEKGKMIGVTSTLGLDPSTFKMVGMFVSKESLDQIRDKISAQDINSIPPLPWTSAESTLYSSIGLGIRNLRYSAMPWIPTINLGYSYVGRIDFAIGTSPFFGNEFGWYYERLRIYQPFSNGNTSFRIGAGIVCQQTNFFSDRTSITSSCLPELTIGAPLVDLGIQFGATDHFIRAILEIRIMRWLSSFGY